MDEQAGREAAAQADRERCRLLDDLQAERIASGPAPVVPAPDTEKDRLRRRDELRRSWVGDP